MTTFASPTGSSLLPTQARALSLLDICEPLFQYICRLNRSARKGGNYDLAQVQSEVRTLLSQARNQALAANHAEAWEKIELVLIFFCDFMIKESSLPWAREWKELAFERHEMAGDEKFFDLLEETLKDRSPTANERLAVFYVCMGLGFTGWYTGQPEYLRRKMKEIAARLQATGQFVDTQRICPDAYEKVDTRDLIEPPGTKLIGIAIVLIGLIVTLFFAYGWLYHDAANKLSNSLQAVQTNSLKFTTQAKDAAK
ncbi:MAG TPA: DotU family type IV/VI secretion system protein [Phycisphaerae bacterium]|jgi:type IV/VI secretion system ImpK/VasF family protein|nr:DotU family type IV/VI secretion system protein [Phycisphaerae bacterium]